MKLLYGYFYLYVILLMLLLAIFTKNKGNRHRAASPFLKIALWSNLILLVLEYITWFVGDYTSGFATVIHLMASYLLYAISFLPVVALIVYYDLLIHKSKTTVFRRMKWLIIPQGVFIAAVLSNPFTGFLFTIAHGNAYTRGPGMIYLMGLSLFTLALYVINIIPYLKRAEGKLVSGLLFLSTAPFVGGAAQVLIRGVPALWSALALMILFTVVVVEVEELSRDYLTGLFNRSQFHEKFIHELQKKNAFTLIMLDLDDFKAINDTLGHEIGDKALKDVAQILTNSMRPKDVIARYGGDEFLVLLKSPSEAAGPMYKERFDTALKVFNEKKIRPYTLKASIGFVFVSPKDANRTEHDWLSEVDQRMYEAKKMPIQRHSINPHLGGRFL